MIRVQRYLIALSTVLIVKVLIFLFGNQCRAFGAFAEHFPEQAASVLSSYDRTRQRQLLAEISSTTASVLEGIIARGISRQPQGSSIRSSSAHRRPLLDEAGINRFMLCLLVHVSVCI